MEKPCCCAKLSPSHPSPPQRCPWGGRSPQTPPRHTPWQGDVATGWHRWSPAPVSCTAHAWGARPPPQGACWEERGPPPPPFSWPLGVPPSATRGTSPRYSGDPSAGCTSTSPGYGPVVSSPVLGKDSRVRHRGGRWPCSHGPGAPSCRSQDGRAAAGHGRGLLIDLPAEQPLREREHRKPGTGAGCLAAPRSTEPS